ncbi:MAG: PepSY domain-containing protein [Oscillibacter sp.]
MVKCQFDWDDGRAQYEVEIRNGWTEYEFEIDAVTGDHLQPGHRQRPLVIFPRAPKRRPSGRLFLWGKRSSCPPSSPLL